MESSQTPTGSFDAKSDCHELHQALQSNVVDADTIIRVFSQRTARQRKAIVVEYETLFSTDLQEQFSLKLHGDFRGLVGAMCYSVEELDALVLNLAMKNARTDVEALVRILCCRNNEEINDIKKAYAELFDQRDLRDDLHSSISGNFLILMLGLLKGARRPDRKTKKMETIQLKRDNDPETNFEYLYAILVDYSEEEALECIKAHEVAQKICFVSLLVYCTDSQDVRHACTAIVKYLTNAPGYFAYLLWKAANGIGIDGPLLNHTILSRCDIDMEQIKKSYKRMYLEDLTETIQNHTSGDYKKMLLALVGE